MKISLVPRFYLVLSIWFYYIHFIMKLQKRRNNISEIQCNMDGPSTTKFVEYWVPVRLSNVQTELYCGSLFSNSGVLCSSSKLYVIETLHKIIVSTRKVWIFFKVDMCD